MREPLGIVDRLAATGDGLFRAAQLKQRESQSSQAGQPRIVGVDRGEGPVPLRVVQGEGPPQMPARFNQLTPPERANSGRTVADDQPGCVALPFGGVEQLLSNFPRLSVLCARNVEHPLPEQQGR
jgi:hypothetical protein